MTNIFKKSVLVTAGCIMAFMAWGQSNIFSASEIVAGTTKGGVSVATDLSTVNKQICKDDNNKSVKVDLVEGKNTANTVDEKYVEIKTRSDITELTLHATTNSSNEADMAFLFWEEGNPTISNVASAELITFGAYDGGCEDNYVDVNVPEGTRTIRIYRQLKKFDGTQEDKSAKYGDGKTFFIADIAVTTEDDGGEEEDKDPVVTGMTFADQVGTAVIDQDAETITAEIKHGGDLTAVTVTFTGNNIISWTPQGAQDFSDGPVDFTISGEGPVKTYSVTITEADDDTPEPPAPSGNIYAHWRFSGSDAPADNDHEDGTNIRVEFLTDGTKSFTSESAAYNDAVPDDMKSQGSKGVKLGGNVLFLKVSTLDGQGFKKDDVVTICGYNAWKISSTADHTGDISASLATGADKNSYNIGSVTLPADAEALFLKRAEGSGTGICAIKVTRGGSTEPGPEPGDDPVAVSSVSLNHASLELEAGQQAQLVATVQPSNATDKTITWSSSNTSVATVSNGYVTAVAEGTATITVTTKDGSFTADCEVTVTKKSEPDIPVPSTDLTLHVPEVYEAPDIAGGYNGTLSGFGGREYEVYYINRDASGDFCVSVLNADKSGSMTTSTGSYAAKAIDGWMEIDATGSGGDTGGSAKDEFLTSVRKANMQEGDVLQMHISGYDQFAVYAKDNSTNTGKNEKHFVYKIDGVEQSTSPIKEYTIRRFDIPAGRHLIEVSAVGSSNNSLVSFSLRVAQEPRAKRISGNDSTQVVYQTLAPKPVRYFVKYASIGEAKLVWDGATATGIELEKIASTDLGDTLQLTGTANCPVGTYHYAVVTTYNGAETSRVAGKLTVASDIKSLSDIEVTAYQGEEMDQISFRYYALSADDVNLTWTNATPDGITHKGSDGKFVIGGTPTTVGEFPYEVSVLGADTVIKGKVTVRALDFGTNPVLYLFKNNNAPTDDGVYNYLASKNWNLVERKALDDLRPAEQYAKYKWILISEDADANNPEVIKLIRGGADIPVLNMNGFTYAGGEDRLGWGEPNNGTVDTLTNNGCNIFVERSDHPIFKGFRGKNTINIFSKMDTRGVMPIKVTLRGTHCLATAYTRNIEEYYADGEKQTIIHEVPAAMRGGQKYIAFPISKNSTPYLTDDGKKLLDAIVSYLTNSAASPVVLPELQINRFILEGHEGTIDQADNTIEVKLSEADFTALDSLRNAKPDVTLADRTYSHLIPGVDKDDEGIDFRYSAFLPVTFTVTDYINVRTYSVSVRTYRPEGLENVYTAGEWVNIFDIYGRKVATTNEDIYTMPLPQGMYIIVTATGNTLKIMR